MAKPKKVKAAAAQGVLQSRDDVVAAIGEIGRAIRERTRIEARMSDQMADLKTYYEEMAAPHAARIIELQAGVQAWCEAHRDELTQGGKTKTVALPTGEVKWRTTPPAVQVRGAEAVMALLVDRGLDRFIRVKAEVNKEAILNEPDVSADVPGITIVQREEFIVEPFEAELSEVAA